MFRPSSEIRKDLKRAVSAEKKLRRAHVRLISSMKEYHNASLGMSLHTETIQYCVRELADMVAYNTAEGKAVAHILSRSLAAEP